MRLLFLAPLCIATAACTHSTVSDANFNFPAPPDELMRNPAPLKPLKATNNPGPQLQAASE